MGEFKKDLRHGFGVMKWPLGYIYEGYYNKDCRNKVNGKLTFPNKDWYNGKWTENLMNGFGEFFSSSENVIFKGKFKKGVIGTKG